MSAPDREALELFLQEASEHLQILREYAGVLQEDAPREEDVQKLLDAAGALTAAAAKREFPLFSEIAEQARARLSIRAKRRAQSGDARPADGISRRRHLGAGVRSAGNRFERRGTRGRNRRIQTAIRVRLPRSSRRGSRDRSSPHRSGDGRAGARDISNRASLFEQLPEDGDVSSEVLEFFLPEAEEHLQVVTDCLLALEANAKHRGSEPPVPLDAHGQGLGGASGPAAHRRRSRIARKI